MDNVICYLLAETEGNGNKDRRKKLDIFFCKKGLLDIIRSG